MNSFGSIFRVTLWGESHGTQIGVSIDGVPSGIPLSEKDFIPDIDRRRAGARGTTPRRESDTPHIVSGTFEGFTTGAPLTVLFLNENTRSSDYHDLRRIPRPSHADFTAFSKFNGYNDYRGGGHFSGRVTLALVAAGAVAKKILGENIHFTTDIAEIGGSTDKTKFEHIIASTAADGDSVGGIIECRVDGVKVGLGEPFFDSAESLIAHLLFSVPAVKGVEFGSGFAGSRIRGSQNNDSITDSHGTTASNNAGGINGGITNGNQIVVRAAVKPTPTISRPQQTYDFGEDHEVELAMHGRHDTCIALRAGVVIEAAVAIALADLKLRNSR